MRLQAPYVRPRLPIRVFGRLSSGFVISVNVFASFIRILLDADITTRGPIRLPIMPMDLLQNPYAP